MRLWRIDGLSSEQRDNMRMAVIEGCLIVAATQAMANFIAVYLIRLGGTEQQVGWLASVPFLINSAALLVSSRWAAPPPKALQIAFRAAVSHRLFFALVPWAVVAGPWAPLWVIVTYSMASGVMSLSGTFWQTAVSDLFPTHLRGRVFGMRNVYIFSTAFVVTFLAGLCLDAMPFPTNFVVTFVGVAAMGSVATFYLLKLRIPSEGDSVPKKRLSWRGVMTGDNGRTFWMVAVPIAFFNMGLHGMAPVVNLYFIDRLGFSNTVIGLLMSLFVLSQVAGSIVWGVLADRWGHRIVAATALGGMALQAMLFWWVPSVTYLAFIQIGGGFCAAGVMLGTFNMTITLGSRAFRSQIVTWVNIFANLAAFVGPLAATAILIRHGFIAAFVFGFGLRLAGAMVLAVSHRGRRAGLMTETATVMDG